MKKPVFEDEQQVIFLEKVYQILVYVKSHDAYLLRGYAAMVKEKDLKPFHDEKTNTKASVHQEGMEPRG